MDAILKIAGAIDNTFKFIGNYHRKIIAFFCFALFLITWIYIKESNQERINERQKEKNAQYPITVAVAPLKPVRATSSLATSSGNDSSPLIFPTKCSELNSYPVDEKSEQLIDAINYDLNDCVNKILREGGNPNFRRTPFDVTPLAAAITKGSFKSVKALIDSGASVNALLDGKDAYELAVSQGEEEIAKYLKIYHNNHNNKRNSKLDGEVYCEKKLVSGLEDTVIKYKIGNKIYAINGKARSRAEKNGWIDGFRKFSPDELQDILRIGLAACS